MLLFLLSTYWCWKYVYITVALILTYLLKNTWAINDLFDLRVFKMRHIYSTIVQIYNIMKEYEKRKMNGRVVVSIALRFLYMTNR